MNIYLISQDVNNDYDTFDSAVVIAESKEEARMIHPTWTGTIKPWDGIATEFSSWCDAKDVKVKLIGQASNITKQTIICTSFNAG